MAVLRNVVFLYVVMSALAATTFTVTRIAANKSGKLGTQACSTTGSSCLAPASSDGSLGAVTLSFDLKGGTTTLSYANQYASGTYTVTIGQQDPQTYVGMFQLGGKYQALTTESLKYDSTKKIITHDGVQTCNAPLVNNCCYAATVKKLDAATICYFGDHYNLKTVGSPGVSYNISSSNGVAKFTVTPGMFSNETITIVQATSRSDISNPGAMLV